MKSLFLPSSTVGHWAVWGSAHRSVPCHKTSLKTLNSKLGPSLHPLITPYVRHYISTYFNQYSRVKTCVILLHCSTTVDTFRNHVFIHLKSFHSWLIKVIKKCIDTITIMCNTVLYLLVKPADRLKHPNVITDRSQRNRLN